MPRTKERPVKAAAICFAVPIVGILMLASGAGGAVPRAGAALCGFGIGAEVDLTAFFLSRYLGMKALWPHLRRQLRLLQHRQ